MPERYDAADEPSFLCPEVSVVAAVSLPIVTDESVLQPPRTRGDCEPKGRGPWAARPCLWKECKFHLAADAARGQRPAKSCALDVADRGGASLEKVGAILHLTGESIRRMEKKSLPKLLRKLKRLGLDAKSLIPGVNVSDQDRRIDRAEATAGSDD